MEEDRQNNLYQREVLSKYGMTGIELLNMLYKNQIPQDFFIRKSSNFNERYFLRS
jgi:hypothetical protein